MTSTSQFRRLLRVAGPLAVAAVIGACSVGDQSAPALTGPSERALSLTMAATPDQLPRDGVSQASITITARDPFNQPVAGLSLSVVVNPTGAATSQTSLQTDVAGQATVVVTALPATSLGNTVTVSVLPVGTNFANSTAGLRSVTIRVLGPDNETEPTPLFTTVPEAPTETDTITFDASTTQDEGGACRDACTYDWDFGDGTSATGRIVTHKYTMAGSYTVTLSVSDAAGTRASTTRALLVGDVAAPGISFTASPAAPTAGQAATFSAVAAPAPGHFIASYSWQWGDGTSDQTSNPTIVKVFSANGTYAVTLTVTDDLGQSASATRAIVVGNSLTPAFTFSPTNPTTATAVNFNASSSTTSNGNAISTYAWDFGDGTTSTGASPTATHTYATAATYVVQLTITDAAGGTASVTQTVTVDVP